MRLFIQPADDMPGTLAVERALQVLRDAWIQASGGATLVDENETTIGVVLCCWKKTPTATGRLLNCTQLGFKRSQTSGSGNGADEPL